MKRLNGKTIALAGQRKSEELSKLVENLGGQALIRPAQGTVFLDDTNVEKEIVSRMRAICDNAIN